MATGIETARRDYCLRSSDSDTLNREFGQQGFIRMAPCEAVEGDVLLVRPGAGQLHVVILTPPGYLHADIRLRRTVEVPGPVPWPIVSAWRHPRHGEVGLLPCQAEGSV